MEIILNDKITKLPQEVEKGNVEYKRKLNFIDKDRFQGLVTQMIWRLEEGNGIAYYFIGVDDDGSFYGLKKKQLRFSQKVLESMAKKCNANMKLVSKINKNGYVAQFKITKNNANKDIKEIKIAFVGHSNTGKSTLISVLSSGHVDNGYGICRINMFNHKHEIHSGLTSSISCQALGFNNGKIINSSDDNFILDDICKKSDRIVTLIDLPGYKKYTKTTLFGLCSYCPEYIGIVVNICSQENIKKSLEEIKFYSSMKLPMFIAITKIDQIKKNNIDEFIDKLNFNREFNIVEDENDLEFEDLEKNIQIFKISCVEKTGINLLLKYFTKIKIKNNRNNLNKEFIINDVFFNYDVGLILSGIMASGQIKLGDSLLIGCFNKEFSTLETSIDNIKKLDDDLSEDEMKELTKKNIDHNIHLWEKCVVKSIHRKQVPFEILKSGESATIAISISENKKYQINKNMIIIDRELRFNISNEFKIIVENIDFKKNSNIIMHYRNIIETLIIYNIKNNIISVSSKQPIYIRENNYVILRQNSKKYVGKIIDVVNLYC